MNGLALLGLILILYAIAVVAIALKKPKSIWEMSKIRFIRDRLGEKGTVIFFFAWAVIATGIGIWLLVK